MPRNQDGAVTPALASCTSTPSSTTTKKPEKYTEISRLCREFNLAIDHIDDPENTHSYFALVSPSHGDEDYQLSPGFSSLSELELYLRNNSAAVLQHRLLGSGRSEMTFNDC